MANTISLSVSRIAPRNRFQPPGGGGVEHTDITEVYHIISGNATLLTGGAIENVKPPANSGPVAPPPAAEIVGGEPEGGTWRRRRYSAEHAASVLGDHIERNRVMLMRPDPHKVLPVMNLFAK